MAGTESSDTSKAASPASRIGIFFTGLVLIIIGVALFIFGGKTLRYGWASDEWDQVSGTVTHSNVSKVRIGNNQDGSKPEFKPNIKYRYSVDGTTYNSDRILFGAAEKEEPPHHPLYTDIRAWKEKYPEGAKVTVWVNPDDPNISVLEPGLYFSVLLIPGVGLFFGFIGLVMAVGSIFAKITIQTKN